MSKADEDAIDKQIEGLRKEASRYSEAKNYSERDRVRAEINKLSNIKAELQATRLAAGGGKGENMGITSTIDYLLPGTPLQDLINRTGSTKIAEQVQQTMAGTSVALTGQKLAKAASTAAGGGSAFLAGLGTAGLIGGGLYAAEQVAELLGVRGGAGFVGTAGTTTTGKRKRMNPANFRALGRATRRLASYHKMAAKVERSLRKFAPRKRSGSYGVITRSEASRALRR